MTMSPQRLREELREASEAVSQATAAQALDSGRSQGGLGLADLKHLRQDLLDNARKQLARARTASLQAHGQSALPGLPGHQTDDRALDNAQDALANLWRHLAELQIIDGRQTGAIAAYKRTVALSPNVGAAHAQLADLLENRHDLAGALEHAERALALDAANVVAMLALARVLLRQERFAQAERAALRATETPRAMAEDRASAWALVGEARDRRDDTAGAFKAFTSANQFTQRRYGDIGDLIAHPAHPSNVRHLTQLVEHRSAERPNAAFATPAPVFLIGFPRSGTTLLEQILASHSQITCLGETNYLFDALAVVLREGDVFARIDALRANEIETVRQGYARIVQRDHPGAGLIVDKHPLHITLLPLINKIFPDAKIIFALRDPRDAVLSCYQQSFSINVATAQFLELTRTAEYFDAVMALMLACSSRLKLDVHQVRYRDVVADLEGQARAMTAFLSLGFEPEMLRFNEHARERPISSASARQVILPIYQRSVGRWRRYERELAPVLPLLNKWARRLGYEE